MKTISDQINDILEWLHANKDNLDAVQCSQKLVELSVLKASLDSELADAEYAYNVKFHELLYQNPTKAYNRLEAEAQATEEYKNLHKKKAVAMSILEVARSIKRYQNAVRDSYELSKHQ